MNSPQTLLDTIVLSVASVVAAAIFAWIIFDDSDDDDFPGGFL